jgi:hypothetical protein
MTTLRASLLALVAGIVGGLIGAFITAKVMGSLMAYGSAVSSLATIAVESAALEKMQAGDVDGAQLALNLRLDGELINLKASVDDGFKLPNHGAELLARLQKVRQSTGYVPSDYSVRQSVESALAMGRTKN